MVCDSPGCRTLTPGGRLDLARLGAEEEQNCGLLTQLPDDALREVLARLDAKPLCAAACASRRLSQLAGEEPFWQALLLARLPHVAALLEAAPAQAQPDWWRGHSWRQRLQALVQGAAFQAQIYNRERENDAEDFLLSAYDATCSLTPASTRSLLDPGWSAGGSSGSGTQDDGSGSIGSSSDSSGANDSSSSSSNSGAHDGGSSSSGSGAQDDGSAVPDGSSSHSDSSSTADMSRVDSSSSSGACESRALQELLFTARYLPMGSMPAVEEADVPAARLRVPPLGSGPFAVYAGDGDSNNSGGSSSVGGGSSGVSASSSLPAEGLSVGEEVEVQWKGRRSHPFGWWFGTVQSVRGNRVALLFRQYPRSSVWHRVRAPIKPGLEAVVNGDCSFGYVGGLRRLTAEEREEWRRQGAPHPPAPALLQALAEEAADEEEWDDELDMDLELAAELEAELDLLPAGDLELPAGAEVAAAAEVAPAAAAAAAATAGNGLGAAHGPAAAAAVNAIAAAAAAEAEEAAHAPAAPPGQPIAMQLGQAAAVAAAAQAGLPVELAAGVGPAAASEPAAAAATVAAAAAEAAQAADGAP